MFFRKNGFIFLISMLLAGCNSKQEQLQHVMVLQQMNQLATVEYVVTKMIRADDNKTWYKIGDRKLLMSCKATLSAGIDLSKLTAEQVQITGKSIQLTLPRAQLISVNIKPEDIKVAYETVDLLRQPFTGAEKNSMAVQAENQIRQMVDDLGILNTAETNATLVVSNFLKRLGYEKININFNQSSATLP